ncbi:MAG: rhodanese-like domain-containing protein [Pseudohongiellaceae bacterium]
MTGQIRKLMLQFVEFIGNHWILATLWLLILAAIILHAKRTSSKSVAPQQAVMLINRADGVVLDVRDKKEFDSGHIVDSINIPLSKLAQRISELDKHKAKPVIVACKMGQHSSEACKILLEAGFTEAVRLAGGVTEWKAQGLPLIQRAGKTGL